VLAHPPKWNEMKATETLFQDAEKARLLYVASTRAKRELYVAQSEKTLVSGPKPDDSMWRPLAHTLGELAIRRALPITDAPGRKVVERSAESLNQAVLDAVARVQAAATPSIRFVTVTGEAKGVDADLATLGDSTGAGRGVAWGRAVHRSIEGLGRGRTGDGLRSFVRAVAADEELYLESAEELVRLIDRTAESDVWKSLLAGGALAVELTVMRCTEAGGVETITEGVIDAAALGPDGWRVVDWKTDLVSNATWDARHTRYARQVDAYVEMLAWLSGKPAEGRVERVVLG
jgi:ATP-dependent helicase/nuclease subunit A